MPFSFCLSLSSLLPGVCLSLSLSRVRSPFVLSPYVFFFFSLSSLIYHTIISFLYFSVHFTIVDLFESLFIHFASTQDSPHRLFVICVYRETDSSFSFRVWIPSSNNLFSRSCFSWKKGFKKSQMAGYDGSHSNTSLHFIYDVNFNLNDRIRYLQTNTSLTQGRPLLVFKRKFWSDTGCAASSLVSRVFL